MLHEGRVRLMLASTAQQIIQVKVVVVISSLLKQLFLGECILTTRIRHIKQCLFEYFTSLSIDLFKFLSIVILHAKLHDGIAPISQLTSLVGRHVHYIVFFSISKFLLGLGHTDTASHVVSSRVNEGNVIVLGLIGLLWLLLSERRGVENWVISIDVVVNTSY